VPRSLPLDAELLGAVRRELAHWRAVQPPALPSDRKAAAEIRTAVQLARDGVVTAHFGTLLGRALSGAELKACQRAAARLEAAGKLLLLRLGYDGVRLTHLQLCEESM
jgi:hypothetical protein